MNNIEVPEGYRFERLIEKAFYSLGSENLAHLSFTPAEEFVERILTWAKETRRKAIMTYLTYGEQTLIIFTIFKKE